MDLTTGLTGILPLIVLVSAPLSAVVSVLLLCLYRRSTQRSMGAKATARTASPRMSDTDGSAAAARGSGGELAAAPAEAHANATELLRRAANWGWKASIVYGLAGLSYALILTLLWMAAADGPFSLGRFVWLMTCYLWPIVFALGLIVAAGRSTTSSIWGSYFVMLIACALFVLLRNPGLTVGELAYFWLFANGAGTVLLLLFIHRRVRAVGPLVLTFIVAGVTGAVLAVQFAGGSDALLRSIVAAGDTAGLGATSLLVLIHVLGFATFAILGWHLLRWIGRRYRRKALSDESITMDSVMLLFGVVQSITLAFEAWHWVFTGLVGFIVYKIIAALGFRLALAVTRQAAPTPNLLLLRVFALGARSERFFHLFSKWWRRVGSISLIAGPDLLTSTVEPHAFLDFVSGRHKRRFIHDENDLERQSADLDRMPDPDGRYRVNEFFCHEDTWRMTMRRMASDCDAVLMDLRGFSSANQGCQYELGQILDVVDLDRVLFLVDASTDRPFLADTLQRLWVGIGTDSPNRRMATPRIRLFESANPSVGTMLALLPALLGK